MKNGLDFRLSGRKRGIRQFDWLNFRFLGSGGLPYYITEKEAVSSGSDRSRKNDIYFVSVGKSDRRGAGRKDFLPDGKNNYKNCCGTGVSDTGRTRSADESDYAYCERKDM